MKNFPVGKVGVGVTAIYFIGLGIAIHKYGLTQFSSYNELGDFLAGAFSPVAFLWLVLGFFQQQKELQQNTEALNLQAEELRNSVEQYKEMVAVAQKQLDSDLTIAQQDSARRESETRPYVCLHSLSYSSRLSNIFTFKTLVQAGKREAKNLEIEFVGGFGKYQTFKRESVTEDFILGVTTMDEVDLPDEVLVNISYESIIGVKYKHQYRYFELENGSYRKSHHEEMKVE
ncbi:hypothetical protein [Pantoea stewartii]|uniref:hypothetical protein n=1 Tax=Pantoea stewartii TaxID=66269 RepID=UPI0021E83227|nr:hypothetical protein [Pantoea stewartii]UYK97793.1 hypothetical protein NG832_01800 [Pantoea stewartii]